LKLAFARYFDVCFHIVSVVIFAKTVQRYD
jgi:hypothetical protein